MHLFQVSLIVMAVTGYTRAAGYGGGSGVSYGGGAGAGGYGAASVGAASYSGGGGYGGSSGQNGPPQPYKFDYQAADEEGNMHYRNEEGDSSGTVRGTYGYTDKQGLYRVVEYVADAGGFRANIRTNEPGTDGKESPADVQLTAEQPPAGIQGSGGARTGRSGFAAAASTYAGGAGRGAGSYGGSGGAAKPPSGGAGVRSGKSGY